MSKRVKVLIWKCNNCVITVVSWDKDERFKTMLDSEDPRNWKQAVYIKNQDGNQKREAKILSKYAVKKNYFFSRSQNMFL